MKVKGGIPAWFWGIVIMVGILVSQNFLPLLGMEISKGTIVLVVLICATIILIDLYLTLKKRDEVEIFFKNIGLVNTPIIRKETKLHGYDVYLKLPIGKCLSDFNKQKEPLEQFLNKQVEFSYIDKSIKVSVINKKPDY